MKRTTVLLVFILSINIPVFSNTDTGTNDSKNLLGIEVSSPHAYKYIFDSTITYSVWKYGDIFTGYLRQKLDDRNGGNEIENSIILGYRQFLWNGLFISLGLRPTKYDFDYSSNDDSISGNQIILQTSLGYRFDINVLNQEIYILPIMNIRYDLYKENEWPEYKKEGLFYFSLAIGYRFWSI